MAYTSVFGAIVGREQVEQAVLSVLRTPPSGSSFPLIAYYVAEVERQRGLSPQTIPLPPGPSSYRGAVNDFDTFEDEWAPMLSVIAEPVGIAERQQDGSYGSEYEIRIAALVTGEDEDAARLLADRYGAALMACVAQHGGLGTRVDFETGTTVPFAAKTIVETVSETSFPNPRMRRLVQATVTLHAFVDRVVQEPGPISFPANPYVTPSPWPTIGTVDIGLGAEAPDGTLNTATGANVTDSTGHVIVSE